MIHGFNIKSNDEFLGNTQVADMYLKYLFDYCNKGYSSDNEEKNNLINQLIRSAPWKAEGRGAQSPAGAGNFRRDAKVN